MPDITLVAETGRPTGSRPAGRLRASGKVPGVLYGHGMAPVAVPIVLKGEPKRVLSEGGVVAHQLSVLPVVTTPRDIPDHLIIDISGLAIGDVVRVGDITLTRGATTEIDPETAVVVAA